MNVGKRNPGSAGELMITGVCILAMSAIMILFLQCIGLIQQKIQTSQIARRYMLKMETVGFLLPEDRVMLLTELQNLGITELDLSGTTLEQTGYGNLIELKIRGKLKGGYEIIEKRTSTAKN